MALRQIGAGLFAANLFDQFGEADILVLQPPQQRRLRHFQRFSDCGEFHLAGGEMRADFAGQPILEGELRRLCHARQ